jgi:hypothetical protein
MPNDTVSHLPAPDIALEFHYKPKGAARPHDEYENTDRLKWGSDSFIPIPSVDDTVSYKCWKHTGPGPEDGKDTVVTRRVVSRQFYVYQDQISAYIVVTDLSSEEAAARIKE